MPVSSSVVKDESGNIYTMFEVQQEQWIRHFTRVLNLQSHFDLEELKNVQQKFLRPELEELSSKRCW